MLQLAQFLQHCSPFNNSKRMRRKLFQIVIFSCHPQTFQLWRYFHGNASFKGFRERSVELLVVWQLERIAHAQSELNWASSKTLHIFLCATAPNDVSFAVTFFYILCSCTLMALVIVQRSPTPSTTSSPCVSVSFLSISLVFPYLLNDFIHVRAVAAVWVFTAHA